MTSPHGVLGVVVCPILEDELVYNIRNDPDRPEVVIVDTPYCGSFVGKMERHGMPYRRVDEWDFMNGFAGIDRSGYTIAVISKNLGLHNDPAVLKSDIQDHLVMLQGRVDALALYYGLCGNFRWDISVWARENGISYPVFTFRDANGEVIDDCIGVAVGGRDNYRRLIRRYTGMLFATPAEATNWRDFMLCSDLTGGMVFGGGPGETERQLREILKAVGYQYMVKIDTGLGDEEEFDRCAHEYADAMGLELIEAEPGWTDIGPAERLHAECRDALS